MGHSSPVRRTHTEQLSKGGRRSNKRSIPPYYMSFAFYYINPGLVPKFRKSFCTKSFARVFCIIFWHPEFWIRCLDVLNLFGKVHLLSLSTWHNVFFASFESQPTQIQKLYNTTFWQECLDLYILQKRWAKTPKLYKFWELNKAIVVLDSSQVKFNAGSVTAGMQACRVIGSSNSLVYKRKMFLFQLFSCCNKITRHLKTT